MTFTREFEQTDVHGSRLNQGNVKSVKAAEERILEEAYKLFKEQGVRSSKLQQIARRSSVSLWDINLLFKSKKELVLATVKHLLNKKADYLLINSSLSPSAVTELNTFFKFIHDTITDLGAEMLIEVRRHNPLSLDIIKELVDNRLIPCLQRNVERGLREGFYRNTVDSNCYASTYFYIVRTILESDRDWTETRQAIAHINDIFLHGVLNAKGMRI